MIASIKNKSCRFACRAFRQETGRVRVSIVVAALFLSLLPFIVVKGGFLIRYHLFARSAMAATPVSASDYLKAMDTKERMRQARAVRDLITANPDKYFSRLLDSEVMLALSTPELQRREGKAEVWQYRSESCVLDVYFKVKENSGAQVTYYEVRPRQLVPDQAAMSAPADQRACLKNLFSQADSDIENENVVVMAGSIR